jgi:hypothetical protein
MDGTKEYEVQNMSNWSAFVFVLAAPLSLFLMVGIALAFGGSVFAFVVGITAAVGFMIFLYRYLQQKILVTVGPGSIHVHYLRSPFFVSVPDMYLSPADVESYKFDEFNGARFVLYLKDGKRFRVAVGSVGKTETIKQMAEHIIALLTDKRYTTSVIGAPPRRRATYAEGTKGLVLAIVVIAAMITMGVAIIFFPENHNTGDTVRGIGGMCTCLAFVLHVFNLRRKARKEKEESTGEDNDQR